MKTYLLNFIFISISVLFTNCDPSTTVDFEVSNASDGSVTIIRSHPWTGIDTSTIAKETRLIVHHVFDIGLDTKEYLDELNKLPLDLTISKPNGVLYKKSEEDLLNWDLFYPNNDDGIGRAVLTIRENDFK